MYATSQLGLADSWKGSTLNLYVAIILRHVHITCFLICSSALERRSEDEEDLMSL